MDAGWQQVARLVLALGGVAALVLGRRLRERLARRLFLGLGLLGAFAYANFGTLHGGRFLHVWDAFHYYVGAKYFPELGYQRLYVCTAQADLEAGVPGVVTRPMRDLATNQRIRVYEAPGGAEACKAHFAPERWAAFTHDVAFFREQVDLAKWGHIQVDHGYNATPAWTWVGHRLANLAPASRWQLTLWALLDPLLLLGAALCLARVFGAEVAALFLLVLGTWFPGSFLWVGGALLRMDWLFLSVLGGCLLRRSHPVLAGVAVALAAASRLFPVLLFAGPLLAMLARGRRDAASVRFLGSGALTLVAVTLLLTASAAGRQTFQGFVRNTAKHADTPLTNHMGLRTLLSFRIGESAAALKESGASNSWRGFKEQRRANARQARPLHWALVAGAVLALFAAFRRREVEPWESLSLCWLFVPLLLELTSYYFVFVVALAPLAARNRTCGFLLLGLCAGSQLLATTGLPEDLLYVAQSAWLLAFVAFALSQARKDETSADAPREVVAGGVAA
ncbi:hypothetical protein [Pyxidicoccus xibeiensis]|uniref:hypothetical protein n=1 Tax=Pyxidicoccus xibeiensis TaxID=2906759 RepID=UPI0020A7B14C|nr:hypothetical protein [Pyxidicoccus xibeiensis]MCP3141549.1 hypothetical protein [Pyxidicoccus xibeiensis]